LNAPNPLQTICLTLLMIRLNSECFIYAGLVELAKDLFIWSVSYMRQVGSVKIGNSQDVSTM